MNLGESLAGLGKLAQAARDRVRRWDGAVREVNALVSTSPRTPPAMRAEVDRAYAAWLPHASSPLLTEADPRMTREDLRDEVASAETAARRVLELYGRWKSATGYQPGQASASVSGEAARERRSWTDNGYLKFAVIGATLLGGAAALKAIIGHTPAAAPPAPAPPPATPTLQPIVVNVPQLVPAPFPRARGPRLAPLELDDLEELEVEG
jgi:hypothetical protein